MGNGKWNTFVEIVYWQPFPTPPEMPNQENEVVAEPKKKRGRPKKNG